MNFPEEYLDQAQNSSSPSSVSNRGMLLSLIVFFGILFPLMLIGFGWLVTL